MARQSTRSNSTPENKDKAGRTPLAQKVVARISEKITKPASTPTPKSKAFTPLDLSDLDTEVGRMITSIEHFGLDGGGELWSNIQEIANKLPFPVVVTGDLTEDDVLKASDIAKEAEFQEALWKANKESVLKSLKAYQQIVGHQAEVARTVSDAKVVVTQAEVDLGKTVAKNELETRKAIADYRSTTQNLQDDLSLSLRNIMAKYTEGSSKKQLSAESQSKEEKEVPPFRQQLTTLKDKFLERRNSRRESSGITIIGKAS